MTYFVAYMFLLAIVNFLFTCAYLTMGSNRLAMLQVQRWRDAVLQHSPRCPASSANSIRPRSRARFCRASDHFPVVLGG